MKKEISKLWNFFYEITPTRHIKYKKIDFALCNKSIMANKLVSTNLEQFIRRIKSPLKRNSAKYIARKLSQL